MENFDFLFLYFVEFSKFSSMKIFALVIRGNKYLSNYNPLGYNIKFYMEESYRFESELERRIKLSDLAPVSIHH